MFSKRAMANAVQEFTLPANSYITVLAIDGPNDDDNAFQVTNQGNVTLLAEAIHEDANDEEKPKVENIEPNQTVTFEIDASQKAHLKITNNSDEVAVFTATGGKVTAEGLAQEVKSMVRGEPESV